MWLRLHKQPAARRNNGGGNRCWSRGWRRRGSRRLRQSSWSGLLKRREYGKGQRFVQHGGEAEPANIGFQWMSGPDEVADEASALHSRHKRLNLGKSAIRQKYYSNGVLLVCSGHLLRATGNVAGHTPLSVRCQITEPLPVLKCRSVMSTWLCLHARRKRPVCHRSRHSHRKVLQRNLSQNGYG
mgnify:CR=1 FL=1